MISFLAKRVAMIRTIVNSLATRGVVEVFLLWYLEGVGRSLGVREGTKIIRSRDHSSGLVEFPAEWICGLSPHARIYILIAVSRIYTPNADICNTDICGLETAQLPILTLRLLLHVFFLPPAHPETDSHTPIRGLSDTGLSRSSFLPPIPAG
jgi:hypothetical protein